MKLLKSCAKNYWNTYLKKECVLYYLFVLLINSCDIKNPNFYYGFLFILKLIDFEKKNIYQIQKETIHTYDI